MARRQRVRIAEGIYDDQYGRAAVVKVGRVQREQRFPHDTAVDLVQAWRTRTKADITDDRDETATIDGPIPERGTFNSDLPRRLKQIEGRKQFASDRSHLHAWKPIIGNMKRSAIRPAHLNRGFVAWQIEGKKPRTLRHRLRVIREMWVGLDGAHARPPIKGLKLPKPARPHPTAVPIRTIQKVAKSLKAGGKQKGTGFGSDSRKAYARFLVRATTGQRPAQVMSAEPSDVDLKRRIWFVRPAKGGDSIPLPLTPEMVTAWKHFIAAKAWGHFDTRSFSKTARRHGWPKGIRPYNLRHTFAIDHLLAGTSIGNLQGLLGHAQIETTRKHYAPVLLALLKKTVGKRKLKLA